MRSRTMRPLPGLAVSAVRTATGAATPLDRRLGIRILLLAVAVFFLLTGSAIPAHAAGKSYTIPQVDIEATVSEEGHVEVTETRTYSFNGQFEALWFEYDSLGDDATSYDFLGASVSANEAHARGESADHESLVPLPSVPFNTQWREEGGPGEESYSVDTARNTLWVFFGEKTTGEKRVSVHYRMNNLVDVYRDVAELYWNVIGDGWTADNNNVHLTIHFPEGDPVPSVGNNFRAWGHGDVRGEIQLDSRNYAVIATIPKARAGDISDVRVIFPKEWLNSDVPVKDDDRLNEVLAEERPLADHANKTRRAARLTLMLYPLPAILVLVVGLVLLSLSGRTPKPIFRGDYWRDVPDANLEEYGITKGIHPAIVGKLYNPTVLGSRELNASFMHLLNRRILTFTRLSEDNYEFATTTAKLRSLSDPIDVATTQLLFGECESDLDEVTDSLERKVTVKDIEMRAKENPYDVDEAFQRWKEAVESQAHASGLTEPARQPAKRFFTTFVKGAKICGWVWAVGGLAQGSFYPSIALGPLPFLLAVYFLDFLTPNRIFTRAGVELKAHSKALRKWLLDFTNLPDAPPTHEKIWGYFITYAVVYGISDKVIDNLRIAAPEVLETSTMELYRDFHSHQSGGSRANMTSPFDPISNNVNSAVHTVYAATSKSSSWEGSGGGFSSGGGGGHGGGGGGAR